MEEEKLKDEKKRKVIKRKKEKVIKREGVENKKEMNK